MKNFSNMNTGSDQPHNRKERYTYRSLMTYNWTVITAPVFQSVL